jgi:myo-inositol 2-dehydrogenase / D-chiro-inositol 1-dehydrogenase
MLPNTRFPLATSRRHFLKTSGTAALAAAVGARLARPTFAANTDTLRIGLIGCGGRGTGAASQALHADSNVILTAVADVFSERIQGSLNELKRQAPDRVRVEVDHQFVGLDAYEKVLSSGVDVVLLTTPPGFRPQHFKAAIAAGKHVFCEKPMATDAPGVRSVLATAEEAKKKNLAVVAGFCWRYDYARREFYKRIHDGAIGDLRAVYATYLTGPVKPMPRADQRPPGMSDVEWQLRNWYNFVWLSGDGLVEQACHSIDKIAWAMNGMLPVKAVGNGGRQIPNNEGNIYDHIDVFYEYQNGVRAFMAQRQISNCYSDNSDYLMGATGLANIRSGNPAILGRERWRYSGPKKDMYQVEHDELFASIRKGEPINDGVWMCNSTLMAIMGRTAAYTGQEISWEQAMNSDDKLVPDGLTWDMKLEPMPMAMPGRTRLV